MEISNAHHQEFSQFMTSHPLEEVLGGCPKGLQQQERKVRPHPDVALRCPRCDSTNTKFCYYNNYSLTQPRYFCKGCRRYWTQGGTLRNVPVGGGCRKHKRSSSSSSSSSKKAPQDQVLITTTNPNPLLPTLQTELPPFSCDSNDLTLAFAKLQNPNPNVTRIPTANTGAGFLDILRSGFLDSTTTTTTAATSAGFHDLYYGYCGSGVMEDGESGIGGEQVFFPFDGGLGSATTDSQGVSCKEMDGGEDKVVMGLPWQLAGDGNIGMDSGRDYWSGLGSSWHGLVNSSLM